MRQWVLSVPKPLRYFMQRDRAVLDMVLRIFLRVIVQSLQAQSPGVVNAGKAALHMGTLAFIPRFGSSLNEHLDFHMCVIDGVFEEVAATTEVTGQGQAITPRVISILSATFMRVLRLKCKPACIGASCRAPPASRPSRTR